MVAACQAVNPARAAESTGGIGLENCIGGFHWGQTIMRKIRDRMDALGALTAERATV